MTDLSSFSETMKALILRLRLAEAYIELLLINGFDDPDTRRAEEAWKKAKGDDL